MNDLQAFADGINIPVINIPDFIDFQARAVTEQLPTIADEISPLEKIIRDLEPFTHQLRIGHLNTSSIPKHHEELQRVVVGADFDIFASVETNVKPNTPAHRVNIPGYKFIRQDRINRPKGGIGVFFKLIYKPKRIDIRYE